MAKILVIDDDAAMRRIVMRMLESTNHQVFEAKDGQRGLALLAEQGADLVITDIIMPEKEGIQTIREIQERSPDTKIIAMSGGGISRNLMFLDVARAFGADAALAKPFKPQELIDAIERLLPSG
jgi:CheY-like chemotaxis protein